VQKSLLFGMLSILIKRDSLFLSLTPILPGLVLHDEIVRSVVQGCYAKLGRYKPKAHSKVLNHIGNVLRSMGDTESALIFHVKAYQYYEKERNSLPKAVQRKPASSTSSIDERLVKWLLWTRIDIRKMMRKPRNASKDVANDGFIYCYAVCGALTDLGLYDQAQQWVVRLQNISDSHEDLKYKASALWIKGEIEIRSGGDKKQAMKWFKEMREVARDEENLGLVKRATDSIKRVKQIEELESVPVVEEE
jgi:tetratricopeptide (TPR) repeat protein